MRSHSNVEMSTTRKASPRVQEWGQEADAPTFLPKDEVIELVSRSKRSEPVHARPTLREVDKRVKSDSIVTSAPRPQPVVKVRTEPSSRPAPLPDPPSAPRKKHHIKEEKKQPRAATPAPAPAPSARPSTPSPFTVEPSRSQSKPSQPSQPSQPSARGSQPQHAAPQPQQPGPQARPSTPSSPELPGGGAPFVQFPNGGAAFDPLAIPLPPDLAPAIYSWLRRLALQADLAGADRLLRDALAELTSSLSVVIVYAGPDGFYTLGPDGELPKDTQPLIAVGKARRALASLHTALVPIVTANETIAVIQLQRNARQPAYGPADYVAMAAFGRESTGVMHHLVVEHLQRKSEFARDKGSLYRPEALDHHRKRGTEGVVADLSPRWVRRAYPMLVIAILATFAFAFFIKVPTYSTGTGIIEFPGLLVSAPAAGNVSDVLVKYGDAVHKNQPLAKLSSQEQESEFRRAETELKYAEAQYLFDPNDEQVRKSLAGALAGSRRAQEAVEQRIVKAPREGVITELPVTIGHPVQFGDQIAKISDTDAIPELHAYLPGNDIAQLQAAKEVQIELQGYQRGRDIGAIDYVARTAVGGALVKHELGTAYESAVTLADGATYTEVKAKLKKSTFEYHGKQWNYTGGMQAKVEVKLESKRFLSKLLPDLSHLAGD